MMKVGDFGIRAAILDTYRGSGSWDGRGSFYATRWRKEINTSNDICFLEEEEEEEED